MSTDTSTVPFESPTDSTPVEPDLPPSLSVSPDPSFPPDLQRLWSESSGDPEICVAVLDGPVELEHPCFADARLTVLETLVPQRVSHPVAARHGTHVASLIFGQGNGSIRGIAPECRGLLIPIFQDGPNGSMALCSQLDLARAIGQAMENGAHVINISGGQLADSDSADPVLVGVVRECAANDVLIVAAAGNDGCACLHLPAAIPAVAVVGAMDSDGRPLASSNWGNFYRSRGILATGENVVGAAPGGATAALTGTSVATPIVSGVIALFLSIQRQRGDTPSPHGVWNAILASAIGCNEQAVPDCDRLLAGRLNIAGALRRLAKGGTMERSDTTVAAPADAEQPDGSSGDPGPGTSSLQPTPDSHGVYRTLIDRSSGRSPGHAALSRASAISGVQASSSECGCSSGCSCTQGAPGLVYALGQVGYDFGTEARRDAFMQQGVGDPYDPGQLSEHLQENPSHATGVIWTLNQDATPIYAIRPAGAYAAETYERLREFLDGQWKEGVERVSIPGVVSGTETLMSGQVVPVIYPELRGMFSWSTAALLEAVVGKAPAKSAKEEERRAHEEKQEGLRNFLERVYEEMRNLGLTSQERALNFSATNAFQAQLVFKKAIEEGTQLDTIEVEKSPLCRPGADCWEVKLIFFDPARRFEQARKVYRFTVDVTDVVPATLGTLRQWHVY